jgi:segregation and condensation protein B
VFPSFGITPPDTLLIIVPRSPRLPAVQLRSVALRYCWPESHRRHGVADRVVGSWRRDSDGSVKVEATGRDARLQRVEAILLLAREPISSRKLSEFANLADGTEARTLVRRLNRLNEEQGRAFRIEEVGGGYQMLTRPKFAAWLQRLGHVPAETRLSAPAMETLAVIAYRQPVLRADIEAVRGVSCGEILRQLMERDLVRISGRSEELGRPYLYSTTKKFLQLFGLPNIDKLPRVETMRNVSGAGRASDEDLAPDDEPLTPDRSVSEASPSVPASHGSDNVNPEQEESQVIVTTFAERHQELATDETDPARPHADTVPIPKGQASRFVQDLEEDDLEDEDFEDEDDDEDDDYFDDEDDEVDDDDDDDEDVIDDEDDLDEDDDDLEDDEEDEWEEVDDEDDDEWDDEDDDDDLDWDDEDDDEEEEDDEEEWD